MNRNPTFSFLHEKQKALRAPYKAHPVKLHEKLRKWGGEKEFIAEFWDQDGGRVRLRFTACRF